MLTDPLVDPSDCDVYVASPVEYDECVVLVEHAAGCLMVVTDEKRDGEYIVEFPSLDDGGRGWRIRMKELRALLDHAQERLVRGGAK